MKQLRKRQISVTWKLRCFQRATKFKRQRMPQQQIPERWRDYKKAGTLANLLWIIYFVFIPLLSVIWIRFGQLTNINYIVGRQACTLSHLTRIYIHITDVKFRNVNFLFHLPFAIHHSPFSIYHSDICAQCTHYTDIHFWRQFPFYSRWGMFVIQCPNTIDLAMWRVFSTYTY